MFPFRYHCAVFFLITLVLPAGASAQPLAETRSATTSTFRISGKVVDARGGQPVSRCVVAINPTRQRGLSVSMITGEDGQFHFEGLAPEKYQLTAARHGYIPESYLEHEAFSTAIAVGPHLQSEGLLFPLTPQSIIYGVVTDEAGDGIRRAQVRLFQDSDRDGVRFTAQRKTLVTDDRGMYEMANIAPGNYYLAVSALPWYAHGQMGGMTVVNGDRNAVASDTSLDVAYPVTYYANATDSDEATPIPVRGGERIEINMTLNAQHAMPIHLAAGKGDSPIYGVSIQQSVFGQMEPVSVGMQNTVNGVMEIEGVLPGRYDFTLNQAGPDQSKPEQMHFTADVANGETELREQALVDEVTVAGKVSGMDGPMTQAGMSLVSLRPRRNYHAQLTAAGIFSMSVPPGDYEVVGNLPHMYIASVSSANAEVKGRMLTVKEGTAPNLEIAAGSGFAQIDGIAQFGGHPGVGVMVLLAPVDAKNNHILFRRDQSDSDGTFSLFNIIPGRYRLLAIENGWDLEWMEPTVLSAFMKKSIPIQVRANEKLQQTVEVQQRSP